MLRNGTPLARNQKMFRIAILLFLTGAALGPVGDYAHVATGTTGYPQEAYAFYLFGLPWWVPILFGTAALAIGLSHLGLDRLLDAPRPRHGEGSVGHVLIGLAIFLGLYVLSGFLARYSLGEMAGAGPFGDAFAGANELAGTPGANIVSANSDSATSRTATLIRDLPDLVLATGALFAGAWLERSWQGILLAAGTAICGTAVEVLLVQSGAFHYTTGNDGLWGVASWLPWLYVSASVGVGNLARYLESKHA